MRQGENASQTKTVLVESRWAGENGGQTKIDGQKDLAMYLVGLAIIWYELLEYVKTLN